MRRTATAEPMAARTRSPTALATGLFLALLLLFGLPFGMFILGDLGWYTGQAGLAQSLWMVPMSVPSAMMA